MFKAALLSALCLCSGASAALAGLDDVCRHAEDRNDRVTACTELILKAQDRRTLLRAYNTRGLALCTLKRCGEAVSDFEHVIAMDHSIAGYFDNYARALRDAGRFEDALRAADHGIRMAPNYAFLYFGKATVLEASGHIPAALAVLSQAMRVEPSNAGLWEYQGKLLGLQNDFTSAYASFDRALEMEPTRTHVYITRADVERQEGDTASALADLRRYPQSGDAYGEAQQKMAELNGPPIVGRSVDSDATRQLERTQREAEDAQARASKIEAEAESIRQLNQAQEREKAAADAKAQAEAESVRQAKLESDARAKADAEQADRKKSDDEARRIEDQRMKAENEPSNILSTAYVQYIVTKRCNEKRDGYQTVWINDAELDRGRNEIKTIENRLKAAKDGAPLNTDAIWTAANSKADATSVYDIDTCHAALAALDDSFKKLAPDAAMTKKDF